MRRPLVLLVLVGWLLAPVALAEDDGVGDALDGLSGEKALELVKELAADEMKGRKTGYEGGALVENWILGKFSEFGLHPADAAGTYLEPFTFGSTNVTSPIALKVRDKTLTYGTDFIDLAYTGSGKVSGEAVFVGYGICRPDLGWDDYAGIDVKGKVVIAIRGAPKARAAQFAVERAIGYKSSTAADKGAVGFLLVEGEKASSGTIQDKYHRGKLPAVWVSTAVVDGIMAPQPGWYAKQKETLDTGTRTESLASKVTVALEVNATYNPRTKGHNALGRIKGRDPDLNHEIILVGAHMDHLGVDPAGNVYNGADDNASGTAVLVHLADVLTANRFRPKRHIIFCAFGAEEQGLLGAKALAERYPFQGEIVAVLNMDMVGQGKPAVRISGVGAYPAMHERLEGYLPDALRKTTTFGPATGSYGDHWPFHERGIPAFFVGTAGKHPNYHTPDDDVERIDPACLEAAARTIGTLVVKLANDPKPLADPEGVLGYLAREGPRFALAMLDTKTGDLLKRDADLDAGANILVPLVNGRAQDPLESWKQLEAIAAKEDGDVRYRLIRTVADVGRAWGEGRIGLLPLLACPPAAADDVTLLKRYNEAGYRLMDPWAAAGRKLDPAKVAAMGKILQETTALVDCSGLPPKAWADARKALGTHPAYVSFSGKRTKDAPWMAALPQLGAETLPIRLFDGDAPVRAQFEIAEGLPPMVLFDCTEPLRTGVQAWMAAQPEGWALPGSPQRKALRAALGGRLVDWLARAER